ncbi:MAG: hypothetical protein VX970_11315 [Planctomycetota bacterium]|nr:hypothetical protein [Planctomycetota bacterium]
MKLTAAEIEDVVREVLLRIGAGEQTKATINKTQQVIEIGDRVIATAHLSKIAEHATVRIPAASIVTPAARDLAAERKIQLEQTAENGTQKFIRWVHSVGRTTSDFSTQLWQEFKTSTPQYSPTTQIAVNAMGIQLRTATSGRGVLLTPQVDYAICLANRSPVMRAIGWGQADRMQRGIDEIAANLLVLDPEQIGSVSLMEGCRRFFVAPATAPPSGLDRQIHGNF